MNAGPNINEQQILVLALVASGVTGLVLAKKLYDGSSQSKKSKVPPPLATTTMMQTINEITGGRLHEFFIEQFQECGSVFRLPLPATIYVVANSADARAIYKDPLAYKPAAMYKAVDAMSSGPSIVSIAGGGNWHHRRKAMNPAFAPKLIRRMSDVALEKVETWVSNKLPSSTGETTFDVGHQMVLMTISVICRAAFEYDISPEESEDILSAMRDSVEEFSLKSMLNPLRQFATWMLPERQNAFSQAAKLKEFAYKILNLYRKNPTPTPDTVIDTMMKNESYKDDAERVPDIVMLLFAGHDSTGYTMAFALMELARNPKEQQKLREELSSGDGMLYLRSVLNETMRLHPASPVVGTKELAQDLTTEAGYFIPKGAPVMIAQVALSRDPTLYPNPHGFQPSRWTDPTEEAKQALFPFSLGSRNCIGQPLAYAEMNAVLPLLIRQYEFTLQEEGTVEAHGTLRLNGCLLKAKKVKTEQE